MEEDPSEDSYETDPSEGSYETPVEQEAPKAALELTPPASPMMEHYVRAATSLSVTEYSSPLSWPSVNQELSEYSYPSDLDGGDGEGQTGRWWEDDEKDTSLYSPPDQDQDRPATECNLALFVFLSFEEAIADDEPQFTALFVFGDSLMDPGNNNYLANSLAKANYVPYGVDFRRPTGRFCNARTIIDYLGDLLGLPLIPAYTATITLGCDISKGVNYASAAAGILDETGQSLGERFSLNKQVQNFEDTLNKLKGQMEEQELKHYLANSLFVMNVGNNDYINNYLQPSLYSTSSIYKPRDYADLLIKHYSRQILVIRKLGLRKFLLGGIGPLGCIPSQLGTGIAPPGKCVSVVNEMIGMFNSQLKALVDQLNKDNHDSIFVYGNTFGGFTHIFNNASAYGFEVKDIGCCGVGRRITCLPLSVPCMNRDQYLFWDAFHPTQAVNQILARKAYSGSLDDCYPINVKQMAQL
ncbi:LOW QUALITY PROTEIN: GDSL esterase/lipase At5g08460-like [Lycium ferocissimum]|uniref:LOW QUALITY PROTEIN: GDSL esterase/lipase At5g08460-like n=1 Tax=Lycium ferocissimum TaxID=112874 RepID=UPI0028163859|nr:LOW QUALITY PROTEIN: GDSL esterase/lipase At5g08460-like [Lycium ferocissimum]